MRLGLPLPTPDIDSVRMRNQEPMPSSSGLRRRRRAATCLIAPLLCQPYCPVMDGDRAVYRDDNQLSVYGAWDILGPRL